MRYNIFITNILLVGFILIGLESFSQAGSTFSNPLVIPSIPYNLVSETTCGFGDNYTTADIACSSSYMTGDEKIYQFTPTSNLVNVMVTLSNLSGRRSGVFVTDDSTSLGNCTGWNLGYYRNDIRARNLTLNAGTTYYIIVSSFANPQCVANYDLTIEIETCLSPYSLSLDSNTFTTASVRWNTQGSATSWEVEYGVSGFAPGTGTFLVVNTNAPTISGLTSNTNYQFYVRSICGAGDSSFWVGPYPFTTSYCIPNSSYIPGLGITNVAIGTINNSTGREPNNYGDYTSLISEAYLSTYLQVAITFQTGVAFNTRVWIDWNGDSDFEDAGEVYFFGASSATNPATISDSILVPSNTNLGMVRIRVGGISASISGSNVDSPCYSNGYACFEDYTLNIQSIPTCLWPTSLSVANITSSSAEFSWVEMGTASNWVVEYGLVGFVSGAGINDTTSVIPYVASSLTSFTDYEFKVRANCGAGDSSNWVTSDPFLTDCSVGLSGVYTLDPTAPPSTTNFVSLEKFQQSLNVCGISGAVVLDVMANTGPYIGSWDFTTILGSSSNNTITINGNGNEVNNDSPGGFFVRFSSVSFFTINGFDFINLYPDQSMFGVQIQDSSFNISITNNLIDIGTGFTNSGGGVYSYSTSTMPQGYGLNITVSGNEIRGGHTGITLRGQSFNITSGHVISNNYIGLPI